MSELILELFSEEIPAFMQRGAEEAYLQIFTKHLKANALSFKKVRVFSSPRRIAIYISGLPKFIAAKEVELKGPKVNTPLQAIEGFCKSNGIDVTQLLQQEINGQLFYIYKKFFPQTDLKILFLELLPVAIKEHTWPKSMQWCDYDISWVRPLKNIMCLFDSEVLQVKFGHLIANDITYGHRFVSPDQIKVQNFDDYKDQLKKNYVLLDREERQEIIWKQLQEKAAKQEVVIKEDARLLEEVTGLVEWPVAMIGTIPEKFLKVSKEVLISSMRTHQKYFSTFDKNGNFAPFFLFISNLESSDPSIIVHGNEKVLSARLSDALYFYEQDLNKGLEVMSEKLEAIVFHEKLGSIKDKVKRIKKICKYLAPENEDLQMAANLCKNDLVSEMVGEFPELQGIMGYYYALSEGLDEQIAVAIKDHYKPLGPSDNLPKAIAAILALADKLDSLVGLLLAGEAPTGSGDPYALRRTTLGIIRIILDNELQINISELIDFSVKFYNLSSSINILSFLKERAKYYLKNEYDISLINATLDLEKEENLVITQLKLKALRDFLKKEVGQELLVSYKRASNILGNKLHEGMVNVDYLVQDEEKKLSNSLALVSSDVDVSIQKNDFSRALEALASLNVWIKSFFDNVMVNAEDPKLIKNRLLLLQEVKQLFERIAKFDQL